MNGFLQSVERPAYRIALLRTGEPQDALDIVQDAMLRFSERYGEKPRAEWRPLFYTVLYSQIALWHRKRLLRHKWFQWLRPTSDGGDPLATVADTRQPGPERRLQVSAAYTSLEAALQELSPRQQQAVLLRGWQELSVAETARVMNCSEGSVKTHYARGIAQLRQQLGEHWP